MKASRTARATVIGALALAATLTTAGCGAGSPGVAATVEGQVVRESELDDIAADQAALAQGREIPRQRAAVLMVARPYVLEYFTKHGGLVSEASVREMLAKQAPTVSDATVKFAQVQAMLSQADQQAVGAIEQRLTNGDISISPRYASFEKGRGFQEPAANWLAPSAAKAPQGG